MRLREVAGKVTELQGIRDAFRRGAGKVEDGRGGTYSAAKSYLTVLSESLHTELAGSRVLISSLCPGFTRTEFHQRGRMSMKGLPTFMWLDADALVAKSWQDALAGKAISIPGWQYRLLVFVIRSLPRSVVRSLGMNLRRKQRK